MLKLSYTLYKMKFAGLMKHVMIIGCTLSFNG